MTIRAATLPTNAVVLEIRFSGAATPCDPIASLAAPAVTTGPGATLADAPSRAVAATRDRTR